MPGQHEPPLQEDADTRMDMAPSKETAAPHVPTPADGAFRLSYGGRLGSLAAQGWATALRLLSVRSGRGGRRGHRSQHAEP